MKRMLSILLLSLVMTSQGSTGPLIVGNGSGLSEFNVLFWQRQLGYFVDQCRQLANCQGTISAHNWNAVEAASTWLASAEIRFESEQVLGKTVAIIDRAGNSLRLNKSALWLKLPSGDLSGMKLEDVSEFLWKILEPEFLTNVPRLDLFRAEFKKIIGRRASEYSLTLADGRRLAAVNSGNSVAAFAILNEDEKAESLLFSSLGDFAECQATDGTLFAGRAMNLETLDFAYFVGRLGTEQGSDAVSVVDVVFHGPVTYACEWRNEKWFETANFRLSIRLSQQKKSYTFEPSGTRVRFEAIQRM